MAKLRAHTFKPLWQVYRTIYSAPYTIVEFILLRSDRKLLHRNTKYDARGKMATRTRWTIKGRLEVNVTPEKALETYQWSGWHLLET